MASCCSGEQLSTLLLLLGLGIGRLHLGWSNPSGCALITFGILVVPGLDSAATAISSSTTTSSSSSSSSSLPSPPQSAIPCPAPSADWGQQRGTGGAGKSPSVQGPGCAPPAAEEELEAARAAVAASPGRDNSCGCCCSLGGWVACWPLWQELLDSLGEGRRGRKGIEMIRSERLTAASGSFSVIRE